MTPVPPAPPSTPHGAPLHAPSVNTIDIGEPPCLLFKLNGGLMALYPYSTLLKVIFDGEKLILTFQSGDVVTLSGRKLDLMMIPLSASRIFEIVETPEHHAPEDTLTIVTSIVIEDSEGEKLGGEAA